MKKIIVYIIASLALLTLVSCSEEKFGPSIFDGDEIERNDFDVWLLNNFVKPYNIEVTYYLEDSETEMEYALTPAELSKSVALAKLVKYLWLEAYMEAAGAEFIKTYSPRVIHMVGSAAYDYNGTFKVGTAEGGLKVTLYCVNDLNVDNISLKQLNDYYFHTMHHEFAHILHQKKPYDPAFDEISEGKYIGGDWYKLKDSDAYEKGFVSRYSMYSPNEDFVEIISYYIAMTAEEWEAHLTLMGEDGRKTLNSKFAIIKSYLKRSWNIDIDHLRDVIVRRQGEIMLLDLKNL